MNNKSKVQNQSIQLIKFEPDTPLMPVEHENGNKLQLQKESNAENALLGKEVWEEMESKAWHGNKRSQPSQSQAILKLSFSKDQHFPVILVESRMSCI